MKHRGSRAPFLVWWNNVACLTPDSSRYEVAEAAWRECARQMKARRAKRIARAAIQRTAGQPGGGQ